MKIRNGDTPIQLPEIVRAGDAITARWANGMRTALQRLRDRVPVVYGSQSSGEVYNHPFKLSTQVVSSTLRLFVNYGQVLQVYLREWNPHPTTSDAQSQQQNITIGSGSLLNHPDGSTAGYLTLVASTTYGIWLKGNYASVGTSTDYFNSPSAGFGYVTVDGYTVFFDRVAAESSYTTPASKPDNGEVWLFLGSVDIDANLIASIVQWWESDIVCPSFNMPRIEASSDAGNSLTIGTDGKLFVPPIVSGDASNSITAGSDGGAFYDEP
jgi:hypothetical protein